VQELILPITECYMMCPPDDVPDHCQLMHLSQPTLLENTKATTDHEACSSHLPPSYLLLMATLNPRRSALDA
jgi:hypothetical protein